MYINEILKFQILFYRPTAFRNASILSTLTCSNSSFILFTEKKYCLFGVKSIGVTLPRSPPHTLHHFPSWPVGDQLVVPRGVTHISCHYKNTIEGAGENRRTNEQTRTMLGVNSEQKESMQHYISDSICGLTLAWITSKNSTKQLECRHLDSVFFTGPYLMLARLSARVSGGRLPLSVVPRQLLSAPFSNQLSSSIPLPLPDTARSQVQKPFVCFGAKPDKGIVCLADHPYSVTRRFTEYEV